MRRRGREHLRRAEGPSNVGQVGNGSNRSHVDEAEMGGCCWWNQLLRWRSPCGGLDKTRWVGKAIARPPGITLRCGNLGEVPPNLVGGFDTFCRSGTLIAPAANLPHVAGGELLVPSISA